MLVGGRIGKSSIISLVLTIVSARRSYQDPTLIQSIFMDSKKAQACALRLSLKWQTGKVPFIARILPMLFSSSSRGMFIDPEIFPLIKP